MAKNIYFILFIFFASNVNAEMKHHNKVHHHHKFFKVEKPYPELKLKLEKDKMDGYNLVRVADNFTFSPDKVNQANGPNEGHAHIYINGKKTRQYSPYFHISDAMLKRGNNDLRVCLHANDHSYLVINMRKIQKSLIIKK